MSFGAFQAVEETPLTEDEKDFIEYMHTLAQTVSVHLHNTTDRQKVQYYRGMLYGLKCVGQIYEAMLKGEFGEV